MTLLPDSGDPGNELGKLKLDQTRPELLTEATWQHLAERYQLRAELGKGAQACVFQVKEREAPNRRLAVKVYHENTDNARRLFDHESRVLASDYLPQDLVVGHFASVSEPGIQPYLVLEFIEGETIADRDHQRFSVIDRIALWEKLCRSLHRLHLCHLVFGDLSPRNVMVGRDSVIRFVDLAGAKPIKRAYSASQSSQNLGTPGVMPEAWKEGHARTALWTDIYAVSAIGFQILTGRDKSSVTSNQREAELASHGIPAEICRVLLKGLREKDPLKTDDPSLYPTAEHLANDISRWREGKLHRTRLVRQAMVMAVLLFIVGLVGLSGWQKYWEAAAAADLKVWQSLQGEIREQPGAILLHPAVAKLVGEEKQILAQRDEADARGDRAASRTATAALLEKSREILHVSREIDRAERQRSAIGKLLLEDEATNTSGFWVMQAPAIQGRLTELQQRYQSIADRVRAGQTDNLGDDLALLQTDLAELFKVNIEARSAFDARMGYERARRQVPERLLTNDGFLTISSGAEQAQKSWAVARWDNGRALALARSQFGVSAQQLAEWLPRNLTPEELAALEKDNQARVAELAAEQEKLRAEITSQTKKINELNETIAKLNKERLADGEALAAARTAMSQEQALRKSAEAKAATLADANTRRAALQTALDKATPELAAAQSALAATQANLGTAEKARDKFQADAARWKKLATETPGVQVAINEQLAALDKEIGQLDPKDRQAAHAAFVKAATEYRRIEAERADLVKPNGYEPKHPKVKAKDLELAESASTLEAALKKRDAADRLAFNKLQQQIDSRQKLHDDERTAGVAEQNPELVQLRTTINSLKQNQAGYAAGNLRATDGRIAPDMDAILNLAGAPQAGGGLSFAGSKPGEVREIMLPGGVRQKYVWIPPTARPFTMGTPGATDDEAPVQVTLSRGFWVAVTETTQEQYTAVMGTTPWVEHGNTNLYKAGPNFPASYINHAEAEAWCVRLTEIDRKAGRLPAGWKYALPTEAQWEYACRAGTTAKYSFGDDDSQLGDHAWFDGNADSIGEDYAHAVATKKPNAWGLHDMHGNLWEWCQDAYVEKLPGGTDPFVATSAQAADRVLRGGGWGNTSVYCRSAYRSRSLPTDRNFVLGFRPATVPAEQE